MYAKTWAQAAWASVKRIGVATLAVVAVTAIAVSMALWRVAAAPELGPRAGFRLAARQAAPVELERAKETPAKGRHAWKTTPRPAEYAPPPILTPSKPDDLVRVEREFGVNLQPPKDPTHPTGEDLVATGDVPPAPWGGSVLCLLQRDGSPARVVFKPRTEPGFEFGGVTAIGGRVGFDFKGTLAEGDAYLRQDLVRIRRLVIGGGPGIHWQTELGAKPALFIFAELRWGKRGAASF